MKNNFTMFTTSMRGLLASMVLFVLFGATSMFAQTSCNDYIKQLTNGDIQFSVKLTGKQAYVEVFASKNGQQNIAVNIVANETNNGDGSYTYSYTSPASTYSTNDVILARFYSYIAGQGAVFTPGPSEGVWSAPFIYNVTTCGGTNPLTGCDYPENKSMDLKILTNGNVQYIVTFAAKQAYVELFGRKDGVQTIATPITNSEVANANGSFTYSYTVPAATYALGSKISYRVYSYIAGQGGVFSPGPSEGVWTANVSYATCTGNNIIYVSTTGNDLNNGTITAPVITVNKGIALAQASNVTSEVHVAEGTYNYDYSGYWSSITLVDGVSILGGYSNDFKTRDLSLVSPHATILKCPNAGTQAAGPRVIFVSNTTKPTLVEGFVITGGVTQHYGGGIFIENCNSNLVIRNNKIDGNYATYYSRGGNVVVSYSSALIYNNQITNGFAGLSEGSDIYIIGSYSDGAISQIYNNVFTAHTSYYIFGEYNANYHDNTYLMNTKALTQESKPTITQTATQLKVENVTSDILVEVYNLGGQLVYTSNSQDISLDNFSSGIYLVSVISDNNRISKTVLIK